MKRPYPLAFLLVFMILSETTKRVFGLSQENLEALLDQGMISLVIVCARLVLYVTMTAILLMNVGPTKRS